MIKDIGQATADDVFKDPTSYGLPTFDECMRKPELLLGRDDDQFASISAGSQFVKHISKHVYFMEGYRCGSLEEVERMAGNMGYMVKDLDWVPELKWGTNGKFVNEIRFFHKDNVQKRKDWR